jgi:LysR family transcriptional regulator, hydrogen peroxide-inducible genes activator
MNIHQFQYILALAESRHFENAADKCFISQSTLSTMISKFEDEIGIQVFDRKKKPVEVTAEGAVIIEQLKKIKKEIESLHEVTNQLKGEVKGTLTIAVIPTIAPFLLPLFLHRFASKFPNLHIEVREQTTSEIMRMIKTRDLDIGIISLPVHDPEIIEFPLYDESFVFYDASSKNKKELTTKQVDVSNLCLLEEGHCMRNQVLELCDFHKKELNNKLNFRYKAGSIDSLLRFVKANKATTLLPYLAAKELSSSEQKKVSEFRAPIPFRSVGIVTHSHFVKHKIRELLEEEILREVKPLLQKTTIKGKQLLPMS